MLALFPTLISTSLATGFASLVLRIFVGALFIVHGYPKLTGQTRKQNRGFMTQMGMPGGLFDAVGVLEFLGGIFLIVGLLTPIVSLLFALEMIGTTLLMVTKLSKPPYNRKYAGGWELDTVLFASAVALLFLGAGLFSIDYLIGL